MIFDLIFTNNNLSLEVWEQYNTKSEQDNFKKGLDKL